MRNITKIIIHCSDSGFGSASLIDQWHKERGWNGIGYHFVIQNGYATGQDMHEGRRVAILDGNIETGRDVSVVGAHVRGHNRDSIGVCLIGVEAFTGAQFASLFELLAELCRRYNLAASQVYGHYEFDPGKTCPNLPMDTIRGLLRPLLVDGTDVPPSGVVQALLAQGVPVSDMPLPAGGNTAMDRPVANGGLA